jgi:hypothetical protein
MARERALARLIAALHRFPVSTKAVIEPEYEKELPRLKLGKSLLNATTNLQEAPQNFGRQQPQPLAQQKHSLTRRLSLLQWLNAPLQLEATIACHEALLLWLVAPRHHETLTLLGCTEALSALMPRVGSHLRELTPSPSTLSALNTVAKRIFAGLNLFKLSPEKPLHQERLLISSLSSGDPAVSFEGSYQAMPGDALLKLVNLAKVAGNLSGVEQAFPNNKEEQESHRIFVVEKHPQELKPRRVTKRLRKIANFIGKLFPPDKTPSFRMVLNSAKNQRYLGQPGRAILRLRGGSGAAGGSLLIRCIKLLGRKHLGVFHSPPIRQKLLLHQKETPLSHLSSGDRVLHRKVSYQTTAGNPLLKLVNLVRLVGNLSGAEHSSSDDIKGVIEHERFVFEEPLKKIVGPHRAVKCLSKSVNFIRKSSPPDKKLSFLKYDNPVTMAEKAQETEQLSSNIENNRINCRNFAVKTHFRSAISSRQVRSNPSCGIDSLLKGDDPVPERGELAEQPVENFRLLEEIASACPCNYSCAEHSDINYRHPPELIQTNQAHSGDFWWI